MTPTAFLISPNRPGVYACSLTSYKNTICHEGRNELTLIGYTECTRAQYLAARIALSPHANTDQITAIVMAMP